MRCWNRRLLFAVLLLSLGSFAVASLLPIYTDEITWSAILGRLNYDHGQSLTITLQPTCEGFYARTVAPVMWWPRWCDTLLVEHLRTPLAIRGYGALRAFAWLIILYRLLVRLFPAQRSAVLSFTASWITLGVMPCLLLLNRPEQTLLIGTTVFLLLGLKPPAQPLRRHTEILCASAVFLGSWYVLATHPRGLFIAPLAILLSYRAIASRGLRWSLIAALVLLTGLIEQAWKPLWGCSKDANFARLLAFSNFGTAHELGLDRIFWRAQLSWLGGPKGWFLRSFVPKDTYCSNMIPPFAMRHVRALRDPTEAVCLLLLLVGFMLFLSAARKVLTARRDVSLLLLILSGWGIYFLNVLVRVEKNEYEAAYMQPLMALLIVSSAWFYFRSRNDRNTPRTLHPRLLPTLQGTLLLLSLVSQLCFLRVYGGLALSTWQAAGQPVNQNFSVGLLHYAETERRVRSAAAQCSIDPARQQHHLVVDESSYFVFRKSNEPLFAAYFDDRGWGYYRPDPSALFHSLHSSGMITYCNRMPRAYLSSAKRQGDLCCMPSF